MTFASQLIADFVPIQATYDDTSVTRALSWAQSFVESYCLANDDAGTFDLIVSDTVYVTPQRYRSALLPAVPVVNIESVYGLLPRVDSSVPTGAMQWVELTNFAFVAETGQLYDTTGQVGSQWNIGQLSWPTLPGSLKVTYDHGYATIPQPLIDVACRFAQQYLENPTMTLMRKVGDIESRYAGSAGIVINDLDRRILDRYTEIGIA